MQRHGAHWWADVSAWWRKGTLGSFRVSSLVMNSMGQRISRGAKEWDCFSTDAMEENDHI